MTGGQTLQVRFSTATLERLEELRRVQGVATLEEFVGRAMERYVRLFSDDDISALERLTPRQRQVLRLIAQGHKTKEIARALKISVKTVEMHRSQMMDVLGVHHIAEVVRFAVRTGTVGP